MTKINKLVMSGFKSFASKTELEFGNTVNCVLGPNGNGKSCKSDTEVLLSDGSVVEIGPLVERKLRDVPFKKKLDDGVYVDGDGSLRVVSLNPQTMKTEIKPISKFIRRKGEKHLYEITTNLGKAVTTTGCHPVMIFKDGKVQSVLVKDLKAHDLIAAPRKLQLELKSDILLPTRDAKHITLPTKLTADFARFLGYLIGDGYIRIDKIELVNKEVAVLNDFKFLVKSIFNIAKEPYEKKVGTVTRLIYRERDLCSFLFDLFQISPAQKSITNLYKKIPRQLLMGNNDDIRNLIAGLFDTDGFVHNKVPTIEYSSKNEKLIDQMQLLLLRFGLSARKSRKIKWATNTEKKIKRVYFSLFLEGKSNLSLFYKHIPLRCDHKKQRLHSHIKRDVQFNPNVDVLPRGINAIVKQCKETLGMYYKPMRKYYPRLAAYIENRCNPTRNGLQELIPLFEKRLRQLEKNAQLSVLTPSFLVGVLKELSIPRKTASLALGVSITTLYDNLAHNMFAVPTKNIQKLYHYAQAKIQQRIKKSKELLSILHHARDSDIFWEKIVSIKKVKGEKYVYDLTVPDNHNFAARGLFVHNSNILDALCFVLGRTSSKSMRAEKTSHLIFDGGKKKKRAEKGQVDIYFDNAHEIFPVEANEVKVSRIIKKSGQSTYKINDKTHTRTEVLDLLSAARIDPNGYNIILQGDITRFVEMTAVERRKILEEISGISVYEERKHKAVLELDKVEQKLNDADIIMKERKTHLRELKKDRDQALKFKELKDGIDSHKATYIHMQVGKKNSTKDKFDKELLRLKGKFDDVEKKMGDFKGIVEEKKNGIKKITEEIEQKGEVEQIRISKQIENMRVTLEKDKARVVMVKDALSKIEQRKQALEKDLQDSQKNVEEFEKKQQLLQKQRADKEVELRGVEGKIAVFKKKNKLDSLGDIEKDIDTVDKDVEEKQEAIQQIRQLQQELFREKDKIEYQLQTLDERVKKVAHIAKENQKQVEDLKKKKEAFKRVTLELNTCLDHDSSSSREMGSIRKELHVLEEERAKLSARQISSQERVGGDLAVRKIRALKKKKTGIYGTIAELGKVDRKYALALEIAAGGRLMSIVVESDAIAAQCIRYLRENKFGVATFIPLNRIKAPNPLHGVDAILKKSGVHNRCVDLVRYDKKFVKAFKYVFGDTVVIDNIEVARNVGVGRARMVTLGGDLADMSGVMRGGFHHRKKVASFAESDVENDLLDVESKIGALRMKMDGFMKSKNTNEQAILKLRREKMELEGDVARMEKTLHLGSDDLDATNQQKKTLKKELEDIDKKLREVQSSVSSKNRELASIKSKKEQLKMKISTLRNPRLIAELTAFDEARQQVREELVKLQSESSSLKSQITQMMKPEQDRIHQLMKGHDKESIGFTKELGVLATKIKKDDELVKEKEKSQRAFFSAYKDLFQKRDKLSESVNAAERKIDSLRDQSRRTEIDMNSHTLKLAALKSEISGLDEQLKQLKNAKILKGKSEDELKGEIHRFERMLSTMSAVNMKALEIYEQVETEFNRLVEKKTTLLTEKTDVVALMEEIEGKKKEQFMKTFDKINKNFNEKFQSLTKKGQAFLHLENAAKPFDGGMGIKIKIAGQRFMDIRSLSGGEKTMTALAFYFAVQEHEPHSFYLMDEVDAALDKHNSERLSQLIRQYCKTAQYIVISHNDALISESDHLYGVSMDETGVSKVVSLKV